eukprot:6205476-Pleurochrysis_carterae.AAC.3
MQDSKQWGPARQWAGGVGGAEFRTELLVNKRKRRGGQGRRTRSCGEGNLRAGLARGEEGTTSRSQMMDRPTWI